MEFLTSAEPVPPSFKNSELQPTPVYSLFGATATEPTLLGVPFIHESRSSDEMGMRIRLNPLSVMDFNWSCTLRSA